MTLLLLPALLAFWSGCRSAFCMGRFEQQLELRQVGLLQLLLAVVLTVMATGLLLGGIASFSLIALIAVLQSRLSLSTSITLDRDSELSLH
ncbi:hypothetical protein [uncultured Ferrimonas sp.]|uniref:hypothetical protein n=1 Tax=uncultured Ferrimonas sp. TaxID=432640 RepID=UPI0026348682|nr:hypothetical protein [uncultured Ferrimonas sp.]